MNIRSKHSSKIPHPGKGGRKKGESVNDYDEVKDKLNLSLTKTAKDNLFILAKKYNLPLSEIFELLSRSPSCIELLEKELNLKQRSLEVQERRNNTQ